MATFRKYEDINAWKKARTVTRRVYEISNVGEFARDYDLRKQLRRASVSIMANIAEGQGRRTASEFANHVNIARGSCHEAQALLYVAFDLKYIGSNEFRKMYESYTEISKMTLSLAKYLRNS